MADKVTLATITSFTNDTTAVTQTNANNALITTAMDNTLSRDGTIPNQMMNQLDMNSNNIINLPPPSTMQSPVRLGDLTTVINATPSPPAAAITPEQFGAIGNGVHDDTTAVQSAIAAGITAAMSSVSTATVYLQKTYNITSSIVISAGTGLSNLNIVGVGKGQFALVTTTSGISLIKVNTASGQNVALNISNMGLGGNGTQSGIEFVGPNGTSRSSFNNIYFNNMASAFLQSATSINNFDWNQFCNITMNSVTVGFNFRAMGTGFVFGPGQMVLNTGGAGFTLGVGGGASIGDFHIIGWELGGAAAGIVIDGGTYGGNISATAVQFDAGISPAFNLKNVGSINTKCMSYGGAVAASIIDSTCYDSRLDEDRAGYSSIGSSTQNNWSMPTGQGVQVFSVTGGDLTLTGFANGYDGRIIQIYNSGTANNVILLNENTGSTASNRFHINSTITLAPGQSTSLRYVGTPPSIGAFNRWVG